MATPQQNYIFVDAARNHLERKKGKIEKTTLSLHQEKKKVVKKATLPFQVD